MLERTDYYVSIDNKMLEKTKIPGQAELKISATEEEVKIIQDYMNNQEKVSVETDDVKTLSTDNASASYTPSVGDHENYDGDFEKLIDLVYKLGTDQTKERLEQYR